jgi:hypothetical protein
MKTQLLGSAATKVEIERLIGYFYYSDTPYELKQKDDGTFSVHFPTNSPKAGKQVNNCLVRVKKGRYRFETIIEE